MDVKFTKRYESFLKTLDALAEAKERDLSDSFVLSGTGAKFSITINLAWKVMKVRNQLTNDYDAGIIKQYCKRIVESYIDTMYDMKYVFEKLSL